MKLQTIIYSTDTAAAVEWYARVLGREPGYQSEMWTSFDADGATLAVHLIGEAVEPGNVVVSLVATEPLEAVIERLAAVGIEPAQGIIEQPFGRSFLLRDPDGSPVQVNEHHH